MFEGLHNGQRDIALRAGVALAVRNLVDHSVTVPHQVLGYAAHELVGAPVGLLSSSSERWTRYAEGVQRSIQQGRDGDVNDWWGGNYTVPVAQAAQMVARTILGAVRAA
jgi:hypothetical protein